MIHRDDSKQEWMYFNSLAEMVSHINSTPNGPRWKATASRTGRVSMSWDLGAGYEGALKLAREGWPEGVRKLSALADAVPNKIAFEQRYGIAGERPDVPRFLAGDPSNMIHRGKVSKPKPAITIAINISAQSNVGAREFWNYGAALVALVDRLESRGVRVELVGSWCTNSSKRFCLSWHIKHAEDPLDLSAVAFGVAHPAMLRRLGFAAIERSNLPTDVGYGTPNRQISVEDLIGINEDALCIPGVGSSVGTCGTMAGALAFVKEAINKAAGQPIVELEEVDE